jgi:GT2 family glycosyltransferase
MAAPIASVIIPTRNRKSDLVRCVEALTRQSTRCPFEVVVVDDGGDHPIRRDELPVASDLRVLRSDGRGPAAGRNLGLRHARGSIILFTDDDTVPDPLWVEDACSFLEARPEYVGVEGPTLSPEFDHLFEYSVENRRPGAYWTCNVAYRRSALDILGGFSEDFPWPHCEDLDLGFRALELGPVGFSSTMRVFHRPRPAPIREQIERARYTASEVVLHSRYPDRYPLPSWFPRRLLPAVGIARFWIQALRREWRSLLGSPARLLRFTAIALGQLVVGLVSALRAPMPSATRRRN